MIKEGKKIVFFGTPEFAVESLRRLKDNGYNIAAVVTMPDKPGRRGHKMIESDVKQYAMAEGLRLMQPVNLKDKVFQDELRAIGADLFIVIAFRMLPKEVWGMPPLGTFNLHASLLPKYRGAAPINRAVMNGEIETGVTTFFLKHEIDTGDIIDQRKVAILPEENVGDIHDKLMMLGADMVLETVDKIFSGEVESKPQPEGEFIPAPKIFAEDCEIDWTKTSVTIHNQVRGLSPYPGTRAVMEMEDGTMLNTKIFSTALTDSESNSEAGTIVKNAKRLLVNTGDKVLEITELQPAGKKRMESGAFLLGYQPKLFINENADH